MNGIKSSQSWWIHLKNWYFWITKVFIPVGLFSMKNFLCSTALTKLDRIQPMFNSLIFCHQSVADPSNGERYFLNAFIKIIYFLPKVYRFQWIVLDILAISYWIQVSFPWLFWDLSWLIPFVLLQHNHSLESQYKIMLESHFLFHLLYFLYYC